MNPPFSLLLAAILLLSAAASEGESFPPDAGSLNVRDFGAKGNGQDDDTAAFLRALTASGEDSGPTFWHDRIVFVPDGLYLISAPLLKRYQTGQFGSGLMLLGESQAHTVIRLADHAAGYGDAGHPKAVIFTSSKLLDGTASSGGKNYTGLGEGNDAYMNFVENLTIDVGLANPGAVGIDFLGNNLGAVRNVTLRAAAGSGAIGLSMTRKWPGPSLVQNLTVQGFSIGIATAQTEYGLTFDHIRLHDQTRISLRNEQNALAIRDIEIGRSDGSAPAGIVNEGNKGFLAIEDSTVEGSSLTSMLHNDGIVTLRRITFGKQVLSGTLTGHDHWSTAAPPVWLQPFADPPQPPQVPIEQWVSPAHFGAAGDPGQNATQALRGAIATGAAVLYLPHGTYAIDDSIEIPETLRRIVGMNSTITVLPKRLPSFARDKGMFRVASGGQPLSIERLAFDNSDLGDQLAVELLGGRDLVIRDVVSAGVMLLDRKRSGGRAFLDDVCCGTMRLAGPQPVFARQFDSEGDGVRIVNRGSPLSILGLKTEGVATILDNNMGAHSDIFGGLLYIVNDGAGPSVPAFRNDAAWLAASFVEESLRANSRYQLYLRDVAVTGFPERGFGRFVPQLLGEPDMP